MSTENSIENSVTSEVYHLRKQLEIERALEVIRSYTLSIRASSELQGLVHLVSQEIRKIGTDINGGVFIVINDEIDDRNVPIWGSGGAADYTQRAVVPYLDNPIFLDLRDAIRGRKGLYIDKATHQQKIEFFEHLFSHDPWCHTAQEVKEYLLGLDGDYARSVFISEYTSIFILNNRGRAFSDMDNAILKSFGRVFDQSYQRFLDIFLLEQQTSKLKRLSDAKSRLYTNIAHEFRTPLTVIRGMADQIDVDPDRWMKDGIRMINRNANRLLELVNQMLELRKVESGEVSLLNSQDDVISFLKYLISSVESLAVQKEIALSFESNTDCFIMDYDREKLQQVIINLVGNAIKYTTNKGKVKLSVHLDEDKSKLDIVVQDTGIGIAPENLPNIFNRFFQVDNSNTRTSSGFGIGLALVANLVKIMHGKIEVNSEIDSGTRFSIQLPVSHEALLYKSNSYSAIKNNPDVNAEGITIEDERKSALARPSLLLIEDNRDIITYVMACLYDEYDIQVAYNGAEGVDLALENIPDIIISDVMMPLKDGYEVCRILKADRRTSHIPIILLTAKADIDSRISGLEIGADAYLAKPFDKEELRVRLQNLLEIRRNLQEYYRSFALNSSEVGNEQVQDVFLLELRNIVQDRMSDPDFTLTELREKMRVSRSQLQRKISALTGVSPSKYIRVIRLEKAKLMLLNTSKNISEVAYANGFNDPGYFGRVFKAEYDMTPLEWKNQQS